MTVSGKPINTKRRADHFRARAIDVDGRRILVSLLADSLQVADLTLPVNCDGYGRIRHFRINTPENWPRNPLPIVPACRALGIDPAPETMTAQVFQNAACAWRCWYCFVPEELLNADLKKSAWFTADQLVELYSRIPDAPLVIDLSGGSPDLVSEWVPWMMRALKDAGLDQTTYLWSDDNLSTTYLFDYLSRADLRLLCDYRNYGRVCCIKGFDADSFAFNTQAAPSDYEQQFEILRRLIALDIDVYGYVTLTAQTAHNIQMGIRDLFDRLQRIHPNLPLRVVPLRIQMFTPVERRLSRSDYQQSLSVQEEAIQIWKDELAARFDAALRAVPVCDVPICRWKA